MLGFLFFFFSGNTCVLAWTFKKNFKLMDCSSLSGKEAQLLTLGSVAQVLPERVPASACTGTFLQPN